MQLPPQKATTDVVVIGCGAGGGVIAHELGEAGLSVVVLEAGRRYDPRVDYATDRVDFEARGKTVFAPETDRRDRYTLPTGNWFALSRVKGVGGSTLHYLAISPRLHESDFRVRSEDGVADDWPITYGDLEPPIGWGSTWCVNRSPFPRGPGRGGRLASVRARATWGAPSPPSPASM